ncbi:MAG: hypothetical protein P4L57_15430 [Rhizomicrobium sp.]|nr:hypothetical protein [Rhizomicrobium sp.]
MTMGPVTMRIEAPPAYFVHVPKTGGRTLGEVLDRVYRPRQRIRLNFVNMARLPLDQLSRFRFYHAMHQGRSLFELIGRPELLLFTMLREPVERAVSDLLYFQRTVREVPQSFMPEFLEQARPLLACDLSAPLDEDAFRRTFSPQVSTLGIRLDYRPLFQGGPDVASGRTLLRPYPLPPLMDVADRAAILANALRWLEEFHVVGITEQYERSLRLICDQLGIAMPAAIPQINANPARITERSDYARRLPQRVYDQLNALTADDRVLYREGLARFEAQWARFEARPQRLYSFGPRLRLGVAESFPVRLAKKLRRRLRKRGHHGH